MPAKLENIRAEKLLEEMKQVVDRGEKLLRSGAQEVKDRAMESARQTDAFVREHPYQTMGVVLGAGLLLGVLLAGIITSRMRPESDE